MDESRKNREKWYSGDYILVLFNKSTFKRVSSLSVRPSYIISGLVVAFLLFFSVSFLLISFTPIKNFIPGVPEPHHHNQYQDMMVRIDSLESELADKQKYLDNLRDILRGETPSGEVDFEGQGQSPEVSFNPRQIDSLEREGVSKEAFSDFINSFDQSIALEEYDFMSPLEGGVLTSTFDPSIHHYAVDIAAGKETPIRAVLDGRVIFAEWSAITGHVIILQHADDLISVYKHNDLLFENVGNFVQAGEPIAVIGESGQLATGPHLHFELWHKGKPADPENFINF